MIQDLTLILGGARSGKSQFGERLALARRLSPVYLATAQAHDQEMQERIASHRLSRGDSWNTIEEPLDLAVAIADAAAADRVLLVDCLTLWLSNIMLAERDLENECELLLVALCEVNGPVILITNEVGQGIVPDNALARRFRDAAGRLNQQIASLAGNVILITAGLPQYLKQSSPTAGNERPDGP